MEILYRQGKTAILPYGIERCYIKHLSYKTDRVSTTRKGHHHTGFEIHIIESGHQVYEINGKAVTVNAGEMLAVSPLVTHIVKRADESTEKYAITFSISESSTLSRACQAIDSHFTAKVPPELSDSLCFIEREHASNMPHSSAMIECRALGCVFDILRLIGIEDNIKAEPYREEDARLMLAKQYIRDNVLRPVTLGEVASYCCISEKQLTRIFRKSDGITVTEYIRKERCLHIEKMLSEGALSLREISELMNFSSEYYFNAVFKKHAGMTPGAYRKTILK